MTRIVYGLSGDGSGHSSRARVALPRLLDAGHDVQVVTYGRGLENLRGDFAVHPSVGFAIDAPDRAGAVRVSVLGTLWRNGRLAPRLLRRARALRRELFRAFRPEVVVSDFEPVTAHLARLERVPLVSLDNQHRMRFMRYPCPPRMRAGRALARLVSIGIVPRADVSLVTTFWPSEPTNRRTFLFPPLLRDEILGATPSRGEHVLVYVTRPFDSLMRALADCPATRFRVYGAGRADRAGNLDFRAPSRGGFLEDLASARGVVATAGFTLLSECLALRKPLLAFPMRGNHEQELNAYLLERAGLGVEARRASTATVAGFLARLDELTAHLEAQPPHPGNGALLDHLLELVAEGGAGARAFQQRRRELGAPPEPSGA